MGNSHHTEPASQTPVAEQAKLIILASIKQPNIVPSPIVKVADKKIQIPAHVQNDSLNQIERLKLQAFALFDNRFKLKVAQGQIPLLFKQQITLSNSSIISNHSLKKHEKSIKHLQEKSQNDLLIYEQILGVRMNCLTVRIMNNYEQTQLQKEQIKQQLFEELKKQYKTCVTVLLCEIQGKLSIWTVLRLNQQRTLNNFINFIHQQGVDSAGFDFIKQKQSSHFKQKQSSH